MFIRLDVHCVCVSLFALRARASLFAFPCLHYLRFEPSQLVPCLLYVLPCLPFLAYITLDLNPASWAASVAQLAERNPVVTGLNPVLGSSVFFLFSLSAFGLCLTLPCLPSFVHVYLAGCTLYMRFLVCFMCFLVCLTLPTLP